MDYMPDFLSLASFVANNKETKKKLLHDICMCRDAESRKSFSQFWRNELLILCPTVNLFPAIMFVHILFGTLDGEVDAMMNAMGGLVEELRIMPTRARRANVLQKTYDNVQSRSKVFSKMQKAWLDKLDKEYEVGLPLDEEGNVSELALQSHMVILSTLSTHDKDMPKIIVDDIYKARQEEIRKQLEEIDSANITI